MNTRKSHLYYDLLYQVAKHMRKTVRNFLPDGPTKDFMLWILNRDNPHLENYLRMLGIAGSIELELKLFTNVITSSTLKKMAKYITFLNAYFGYETLSDNLGVGLAPFVKNKNKNYLLQKLVLLNFNDIMIKEINGLLEKPAKLFSPFTNLISRISVYEKTLSPKQMRLFSDDYVKFSKNTSLHELEYSFLSILILNVETCLQLLDSLHDRAIYLVLKKSLIDRYASVNSIVQTSSRSGLIKLVNLGLKSILTIPTLAYCVGALEEVNPHPSFKKVINNGLLYKAMADAALLTRLLNDIGTVLLTMRPEERKHIYENFQHYFSSSQKDTSIFTHLLFLSEREDFIYILTRIRKDLKHGEFNICLDKLNPHIRPYTETMTLFCNYIEYYANLYQLRFKNMLKNLAMLSNILGDDLASKIIYNFVDFHVKKYGMEFESKRGDYAITDK